ncbi:hypothetical protein [Candidatus Chrysopegis kryptomonas]|uniref:DUF1640 domain-containing protein n=1 Tax=Candidatus Chryseopegocella kryptomonas TaxID=1633643 RepID=A0A0N7MW54_9BACT|nr:hypothetical protein [Candidatus Chrysopegis kryptomonas]CUS97691.1 hypothetical protein JGI23_00339 [Candidatus Chrysopegis kryptomonas]
MPITIPAEVYIEFEEALGSERAKKIVLALEKVIDYEIVNKWSQTKFELRDELLKEIATKKELDALRGEIYAKIESIDSKIDSVKNELNSRIESVRDELNSRIESVRVELRKEIENMALKLERRFTILFLILLFTIILLNRDALEFILKLLKLI